MEENVGGLEIENKKKASQNNREFTQTGGGPSTTIPLTALEERLLSIMGRAATYGDSSTSEKGLKRQHTMVEVANDNEEEDLLFVEGVEVVYVTEEDNTYTLKLDNHLQDPAKNHLYLQPPLHPYSSLRAKLH